LYRTCPSGNLYEYYCTAIGARSQTANTYLENHIDEFPNMNLDKIIDTAINAMKKAQDIE
jgi:20S proteasome subunit alpha 6